MNWVAGLITITLQRLFLTWDIIWHRSGRTFLKLPSVVVLGPCENAVRSEWAPEEAIQRTNCSENAYNVSWIGWFSVRTLVPVMPLLYAWNLMDLKNQIGYWKKNKFVKFLFMFYSQFFYMPRKVTKTVSVAKLFLSSIEKFFQDYRGTTRHFVDPDLGSNFVKIISKWQNCFWHVKRQLWSVVRDLILVYSLICFNSLCIQAVKALARLCRVVGASLLRYAVGIKISLADSYTVFLMTRLLCCGARTIHFNP